jgi:peptidoglycan/xylan/chitin deacetylase (PgdA/CDA1 family)
MVNNGIFSISLDFELHWGSFETMKTLNEKNHRYFSNTRKVIPEMLSLFEKNELHVTWAIVGMLYLKNVEEWNKNLPSKIPTFKNPEVSAYEWVKKNGFSGENDNDHFAPELIDLIRNTPYQEIGTHTFAHYFCLEEGQNKDQFREDIRMASNVAAEKGLEIKSLVFPRNQFNKEYLSICTEFGITSVRTNPAVWYWSYAADSSLLKKIFRTGDAYFKFQSINMVTLKDIDKSQNPLQLPAARLYRPWSDTFAFQNKLKLNRIINEMTKAAKNNAYYHLWWHPENFGTHPNECMHELEQIAYHFHQLKSKYGMESLTMEETTNRILAE